jgi:hypothetical protein
MKLYEAFNASGVARSHNIFILPHFTWPPTWKNRPRIETSAPKNEKSQNRQYCLTFFPSSSHVV